MTTVVFQDSAFVPFRVELDESSGPVSPRFQYTLTVAIWCEEGVVHAVREERVGSPRQKLHGRGELSREVALKLALVLEKHDALDLSHDYTDNENKLPSGHKGASFNRLVVAVNERRAEILYLLATLEDPDNVAEAEIVQAIKEAARSLPET